MDGVQTGLPLFYQQFWALVKKNMWLSWRSKRSTFLRLLSSLFFIVIFFCIKKAWDSRLRSVTMLRNEFDPETLVMPPIPPCEDKFFMRHPCFDFVWSGNKSARIAGIVSTVMANNPGRPIPSSKWMRGCIVIVCPGALHFTEMNISIIQYGIQTKSTPVKKRVIFEDPTFKFHIPIQIAAEKGIARSLIGDWTCSLLCLLKFHFADSNFSWAVGLKEFAHPAVELFSAVAIAGPTFFLAIAMFSFVIQISSLITEKELKLRQAIITILSSLFILLFGMMFHFYFFLNNSFTIVFLLFFLFQLNTIGFAFMLSAFISQASSSTTVGFFIFIIGFLTWIVTAFGFSYSQKFGHAYRTIWSLFPSNLLAEALVLLSDATSTCEDPGITWTTFFVWFILAIHFDDIIPNASVVRKPMLYLLNPAHWTGKEGGICSCIGPVPSLEDVTPDDEDVLEEESIVKARVKEGLVDPNVAVQIHGLGKTYPRISQYDCCKCERTSTYHAIKGLRVKFAKDQLFCLLGPSGAGKTIIISCLTGITPVTRGDALMYGYSTRNLVGMSNIRKIIRVCPQFDIIWDFLTGEEHLSFFANIKGLSPASIKSKFIFHETNTEKFGKRFPGNYFPRNKRSLNVEKNWERGLEILWKFCEFQDRQGEFSIADVQLVLTTLEEIPVGARFAGIPGMESAEHPRDIMVEMQWDQDGSGALCISGHSSEMPIPQSAQLPATSAANSCCHFWGRTGQVHRIMLDPDRMTTVVLIEFLNDLFFRNANSSMTTVVLIDYSSEMPIPQ
ncbi:hypothetical protein ACJRO7_008146 [Eucalyptus globulus]|uniref:ABC transporter domain-containing protein n=1 Tax=Eucalyptus globulus TaxID=34317 RepID=A0ABD3IQV5_EUCGL